MELLIEPSGRIRCLYSETLDVAALGPLTIIRASHVEPTSDGQWTADLTPVKGPILGPFACRSEALAAKVAWLREHWLFPPDVHDV